MENSQSISNVAENWYARLNRLKDRFQDDDLTDEQKDKCKRLIAVMIGRMMKVSIPYMEARIKASTPKNVGFHPGGVIKAEPEQ